MSSNLFKKLPYKNDYIAYSQINQTTNSNSCGVMFLHGLKSDMEGTKVLEIEKFAAENNIEFTKFDFFGHGKSSGNFLDGNISIWTENCLLILDEICNKPQIIIGSSMGGWIMLLAALKRPEKIRALIGIAAAPDFTEELFWHKLNETEKKEFITTGKHLLNPTKKDSYHISYQLIEDGRKNLIINKLDQISVPVVLLHGALDQVVPYQTSLNIMNNIGSENAKTIINKNSNHRFSTIDDINLIINSIKEFI